VNLIPQQPRSGRALRAFGCKPIGSIPLNPAHENGGGESVLNAVVRTRLVIKTAVDAVAAEIIAGRPPVKAMTMRMPNFRIDARHEADGLGDESQGNDNTWQDFKGVG
jgi:hypothetical protein